MTIAVDLGRKATKQTNKQNKTTLSEHGHVAYQIKENHECSNMVANILPTDPPPLGMDGVSRSEYIFSEHCHVAYLIKEKHKCNNLLENIIPTDQTRRPWGWSQNSAFQNIVMLHIKLKRITNATTW